MRFATTLVLTLLLVMQGRECMSLENFSYFVQYSVNDGLPSSRVFDVLQDSQGYMWFATENGVSRFNGYEFRNFTTREGLPANSTIKLYEDPWGRIWFMSYQGPISYFEDGRIIPFWGNPELVALNTSFISSIYEQDDGGMLLTTFGGGLIFVSPDSVLTPIQSLRDPVDSIFVFLERKMRDVVITFFTSYPGVLHDRLDPESLNDSCWIYALERKQADNHLNCLANGDTTYIAFGSKLYRAAGNWIQLVKEFDDEIIALTKDRRGQIWISVKFDGVHMFVHDMDASSDFQFFKGKTVSGITHDKEGNYWFSTTESGVYFVPSLDMSILKGDGLDTRDHVVVSLEICGDDLFFSTDQKITYHGTISENQASGIRPIHPGILPINNINAILCTDDDKVYISADFHPQFSDSIIVTRFGRFSVFPVEYGYCLSQTLTGDILFGHFNGVQLIREDRILTDYNLNRRGFRVFDALQMPDSSILLGTIDGLLQMRDTAPEPIEPDDPVMGNRISKLRYSKGLLWIGSFDHGLAIRSEDTVFYLDESIGLSSNRIKSIFNQDDSITWVGTNKGLNRVKITGYDPPKFMIRKFDIWDGFPSNEINEIKEHEGYLWIATDKGIVSFDPDLILQASRPPVLVLDRILLDPDVEFPATQPARLDYDQNSITIEFHGITFKNPMATVYSYRLEGLSENWNETRNTSVRFHGLPPGNYTFVISAKGSSGVSSEPLKYNFVIQKRFTRTNGFLVGIILLALLLVFLVVRAVINIQKRRLDLQRKIFLAEQKAMLAQMNPHFIFNSLNSIQNFILESDHVTANLYLVTFSSLMRKVLYASQRNFISLRDELEIVRLYLELEKFRFQGRFNYTLHVDDDINAEQASIPSMILQPYLENAIWHGIMPKKGPGHVELNVQRAEEGRILITIVDDGIGRQKAGEIRERREHHKPTGMKNIEERLKLLNELNKSQLSVRVIDLHDKSGKGSGTRVEIDIED